MVFLSGLAEKGGLAVIDAQYVTYHNWAFGKLELIPLKQIDSRAVIRCIQ